MSSAATGIIVTSRHSILAWFPYFTGLSIEVDGTPSVGAWGRRELAVGPGDHAIHVSFRYFSRLAAGRLTSLSRLRLASTSSGVPRTATNDVCRQDRAGWLTTGRIRADERVA